jgi:hypothetical protein
MKIQPKDLFHGAALAQVVEDGSFTALNKVDDKYGHYLVNADRRLFVKYATSARSPWRFTINPDDILEIRRDIRNSGNTFLCLVCAKETICCLDQEEIETLIDLQDTRPQSLKVHVPRRGSLRVSGPGRRALAHTIPHNAFPAKILE